MDDRRPRRIPRALAGGALLAAALGLFAPPASAAAVDYGEDFSTGTLSAAPEGWTVENANTEGMASGWAGWTFASLDDITARWGTSGGHSSFDSASGIVAIVQSDGNRPSSGKFDSTLWSPDIDVETGTEAVGLAFDSHYRQGQNTPAELVAVFDTGTETTVRTFDATALDEHVEETVDVSAGATSVRFGWSYLQSSNNWYWMIDSVSITAAESEPSVPESLSGQKLSASPGETITVDLGGLREGQQVVARLGDGDEVQGVPLAGADGTVSFDVGIPSDQGGGTTILSISGDGIADTGIPVSIITTGTDDATTEESIWFDGFEDGGWTAEGASAWALTTRDDVVSAYGTDRRQAFTRAAGTIAVAEAETTAFEGVLGSEAIAVTAGDELELRVDSHYLARVEGQRGAVTAVFDDGERVELAVLTDEDQESTQLRLPVAVPSDAASLTIELSFSSPSDGGTWMVDSLQLVRPLAELEEDAEPSAIVDVFSDVQGSNSALENAVLPGFASLDRSASTIVSNGDTVSSGSLSNYAAYFAAFSAGGGDAYETSITTIGNHEYYGSDGAETYLSRFLEQSGMSDVGGEGGLWGEVLVDGVLPVLWIGSESYDYSAKTGSGPFVELSDEQFDWLEERLSHWREQNTPVLLFSHHVMADTVSGTYASFYRNDYDDDTQRMQSLLEANPNVIMLDGHTHWSAELNDWSVQKRFDPSSESSVTIVNTAAVTTQYGPSGDYGETAVGGAAPVGLRAELYDDRVRITAYAFDGTGAAEITHVDVALPATDDPGTEEPGTEEPGTDDPGAEEPGTEEPGTDEPGTEEPGTEEPGTEEPGTDGPEDGSSAAISLSAARLSAGDGLTVTGTGFDASEGLRIELRSDPVRLDALSADDDGSFASVVTIPADTATGVHTIAVVRADGSEVTATVEVVADAGAASDGLPVTGPGSLTTWLAIGACVALVAGIGVTGSRLVARRIRQEA